MFSFVFLDLDESSNLDTTKTKTNLENCKLVGKNVIQCCRNKNYWEYVLKALFLSYHDFLQTCIVQCYGILQCIQNNVASITRKYMFFFTPPQFCGGVIFSLQFVCVCVCESVCLTLFVNKFQLNGCTDSDEVFTKWLLTALSRTLLKVLTFGQRSRSQ